MKIRENEPMSRHTSFRVGGAARWFVQAKNTPELQEAIAFAQEKKLPWFVLGGGTNTLVADKGFDGLVINMSNREIKIEGDRLIAGSGAMSVSVARAAADAGLSGLEWAASLPGTIGGAVRGNAGCFGGEMKDAIESARVLRNIGGATAPRYESVELTNTDCQFAYRESVFKHHTDVIVEVTLKLTSGIKEEIKAKMSEVLSKRKSTQPIASGTAGCAFKNPLVDGKLVSCGKIIDDLGLKGTKIGGISISEIHGNFLLNDGTGTADEVVQMISLIKTRARDQLGIQLQEEIEYVGF